MGLPRDALSNDLPDRQLTLSTAGVLSLISILDSTMKTIAIIAAGHQYRESLKATIHSLKEDQIVRHKDVDKMLEALRESGHYMSQDQRDESFRYILMRLDSYPSLKSLPPPR